VLQQVEAEVAALTAAPIPLETTVTPLQIGEEVWLPQWRVRGVVLKWPSAGELAEVQAGHMTLKVPAAQIEPLRERAVPEQTRPVPYRPSRVQVHQEVSTELNVIGWRVADALPYVDKYLDTAAAAGLERVRIVHGKGSGRLRAAVHDLLTSHPQVKGYMPAAPEEGGWGATLVEMYA
jgi:DNA mismatch repair protein MutS2